MKKIYSIQVILFFLHHCVNARGVALVKIDSIYNSFTAFKLLQSTTNVTILNQVATTATVQLFENTTTDTTGFKYAFPLPDGAGATRIRWNYQGAWNTAILIHAPQDTTFQTDSVGKTAYTPARLDSFLGKTPLYFPVKLKIPPSEKIAIELTYVELLPYANSYVTIQYPGGYNRIQPLVDTISFNVSIASYRLIDNLLPQSYIGWKNMINGKLATANLQLVNTTAASDWTLQYVLHADSAGFFSFSTFYPDSLRMCDTLNGFFSYIVEPNSAGESDVIPKDFVLIIDHSGSMGGIKMTQANEAAEFIVNHLNNDDRFNIVQFDDDAQSISTSFLNYTLANKNQALNYIAGIGADGSTNISGAFDLAVPMFAASGQTRAKIIIFFTDGVPSAGIEDEDLLVAHVKSLIATNAPDISLYTFGIGNDVNQQLLSRLATQNNGLSAFLNNNTVASAVSAFYATIQSPVLLNTTVTYDPPVVTETYPNPLPNLFKGYQMVITGRYTKPGPVKVTLSGTAFGQPASYQYLMNLSDTLIEENNFLPKLWAKKDIDYLTNQYYLNQSDHALSSKIQRKISDISVCYGVVSPFTSFSGNYNGGNNNGGGYNGGTLAINELSAINNRALLSIYPNPASNLITLSLPAGHPTGKTLISVMSLDGRMITGYEIAAVNGDTINMDLTPFGLSSGSYLVMVKIGTVTYRGKLIIL